LPEQTAEALQDGWLRTGDIARIDEDGYVYLVDREKDLIITGGENVYSSEVETALYQHPDIHECAVIGTHDDQLGQLVTAVIIVKPEKTLVAEAIIEHCRELIGGYKVPRRVEFVDEMPKNELGKILKNRLRETYAS
jgi:acyl-CoA synthetase (AMP-forming)/AMP-acid ligase II